jgi:hypothetical protein
LKLDQQQKIIIHKKEMLKTIFTLLPILVGILMLRYVQQYRLFTKIDTSRGQKCSLFPGSVQDHPSVEDLRWVSDDLLLGGNGNTMAFIGIGHASPVGHMVLFDVANKVSRKVDLTNYPTDVAFKPHGLDYSVQTKKLYVMNHAQKEDRIEIFDVAYPDSYSWFSLTWTGFIPLDGVVPDGAGNSVAEVSPNEVIVTHWLPYDIPPGGFAGPVTTKEKMNVAFNHYSITGWKALGLPHGMVGGTKMYRCKIDSKKCTRATPEKFISSNGIAASPDRSLVYVVDCFRGDITVYKRDDKTGDLSLLTNQMLPHPADNVQVRDFKNGTHLLEFGTLPNILDNLAGDGRKIPGGYESAIFDIQNKKFKFIDVLTHDGSVLGGVATATKWFGGNIVLMGGPLPGTGVMMCET